MTDEHVPIHGSAEGTHRGEAPGPPPGQAALVMVGLAIGILLMSLQLWLLTLAFNLYLAGQRSGTLLVAISSGLIFAGGLLMLRLLRRHPSRRG